MRVKQRKFCNGCRANVLEQPFLAVLAVRDANAMKCIILCWRVFKDGLPGRDSDCKHYLLKCNAVLGKDDFLCN